MLSTDECYLDGCDWNYKTITQLSYLKPYEENNNRKFIEKGIQTSYKKSKNILKPRDKCGKKGVNFDKCNKNVKSMPVSESNTNLPEVFDHLFPKIEKVENHKITSVKISPPLPSPLPSSPKSNCTKILQKIIKQVESENVKESCELFNEKIHPDLNIRFDQKLYKNLTSLKIEKKNPSPPHIHNSKTVLDIEPKLKNFFIPKTSDEYSHNVKPLVSSINTINQYDGYEITRHVISWNYQND